MATPAQQFFQPWDPAPSIAPPPADSALAQRIAKLAIFASRNGLQFVELMKTKQAGNPEYAFLSGGEGHEYYSWILYCMLYRLPADQPLPAGAPPPHAATAADALAAEAAPAAAQPYLPPHPGLPGDVDAGFTQLLHALVGAKDSIKSSQSWFVACGPQLAAPLAERLAQYAAHCGSYDRQLHLLYLANDILFSGLARREAGVGPEGDQLAIAFKPVLGSMLAAAYNRGGRTDTVKDQLSKIVQFWGDRKVFTPQTVTELATAMYAPWTPPQPVQPPPGSAASVPTQPGAEAGAAQWQQPAQPGTEARAAQWQQPGAEAGAAPWQQQAQPGAEAGAAQWQQPGAEAGSAPWQQQAQPRAEAGGAQWQQPGAEVGSAPWQQQAQPGAEAGGAPWQQQAQPGSMSSTALWQQSGIQPGIGMSGPATGGLPRPVTLPAPGPAPWPQPGAGPAATPWQQQPVAAQQPWQQQQQPQPAAQQPWQQQPVMYDALAAPAYGYPPAPPGWGHAVQAPYVPMPGYPGPPGMPPPEPAQRSFDPMCFPPGLIPRLVERHLQADPPYSPLSPLEVEEAGLPDPPEMTAYLTKRLDQFDAELKEFRSGLTRADYVDDKRRQRRAAGLPDDDDEVPTGARRPVAGAGMGGEILPMGARADGSYGGHGKGRGGALGLGFGSGSGGGGGGSGSSGLEGAYENYRRGRSGAYHTMILKSQGLIPGEKAAPT